MLQLGRIGVLQEGVLNCLFLTQPSIYRDDLTNRERALLWFGWVGRNYNPIGYVTVEELARALPAFNQALLDVCQQDLLECYDLAADIPKDTSAFLDDVHFNENGARIVAESLAGYILTTPPFADNSR